MSNERLLEGIKVIELATYVAAPSAGKTLADWGADVIKVEAASGDFLRYIGQVFKMPIHDDENPAFDIENSGKRNISLNLKTEKGLEVFHKLLLEADVFLTNIRTAALEKLGLSYELLSEKYPGLIFSQITGYGEDGPAKDKPGFDYTAFYARGGISGTLYESGTSPLNPAPALGDHLAGVSLAGGVCAALLKKMRTGKGEKVTLSLLQTAIYGMGFMILSSQYGNKWPVSRKMPNSPLLNAYKSKDERWIQIACTDYEGYLPKFSQTIGCKELIENPKYNNVKGMKKNVTEVVDLIEEYFAKKDITEWEQILTEADLPYEKIQLWEEIVDDEQAWANDMLHRMEYKSGNSAALVHTPVKFKEMGLPEYNIAAKIGENTDEILVELGYSAEEIQKKKESKVVTQYLVSKE